MKLWLDDVRNPPDDSWLVARNCAAGMDLFRRLSGQIDEMSLDHDLGDDATGYDFICWLEKMVRLHGHVPPDIIRCHSSNPPGKMRIDAAIDQIQTPRT